ncbi:MAG: hypothetical protein RBR08_08095 [Desulforegulaceae bacterium]|nr:hypothetical protein [Desulforegulaceae bacterium]
MISMPGGKFFKKKYLKAGSISIVLYFLFFPTVEIFALDLKTAYSTIVYEDFESINKFNKKLFMGRLRYFMPDKFETTENEVATKVDLLVNRVQSVLEMFPKDLKFSIYVLKNSDEVKKTYLNIYGNQKDFVAFYSPKMNTVYLSPDKLNVNILAHEIGHVVVENFFEISPPVKIHEILAQFSERHLGN